MSTPRSNTNAIVRPISLLIASVAVVCMTCVAGCSGSSSGPTCDDYANKELFARNDMISSMVKDHDLNSLSLNIMEQVSDQVDSFCGRDLDPNGGVKAEQNNDKSISDAVNWKQVGG